MNDNFDKMSAAMQQGRQGEVILGLLHAISRLYQFVETVHGIPELGVSLLDQELAGLSGPEDLPGVRGTLGTLRAILAAAPAKPN